MKHLKIEGGKGFFLNKTGQWVEIDQIGKEDLLKLLNEVIANDFEMDEYDDSLLQNKAHQIIYKHIYSKLNELEGEKDRFKDESEQLYKSAIEKYTKAFEEECND